MSITVSAYKDLPDHAGVMEQVQHMLRDVADHDGVAALSEAFVRGLSESSRSHAHVVATDSDGEVVGVLAIDRERVVELAVSPGRRHRGIATSLFEGLATGLGITGAVDVWAHGDGAEAQRFVDSLDARRTRELLKMAVECAPGSARAREFAAEAQEAHQKAQEEGLEVLTYSEAVDKFGKVATDSEWLRVNNEAFAWHPEQGGQSLEQLESARDTEWFNPDGVWMLWQFDENASSERVGVECEGGEYRCVGFHWTKVPVEERRKDEGERAGEVYVVCLADEARGRKLGGPITLIGMGSLLEQGAGVIELYVEGDNAPAVATYQNLG
ncbi:MAG TPA: mycothiol synthase, partial [Candidatus Corynebacterium gallistercoris]|nr:mycothiol synthase [Candidatus Corynebacterium gallistercoris]